MHLRHRAMLATAGFAVAAGIATGLAPAASAATVSPATSAKPTVTQAACDKTKWQWQVQGRPAYRPGGLSGDYLWHDKYGFHLRVTHHRGDRAVFSGQIVSSAPMRKDAVKLEGRDVVALSANRKVLYFRFANYGHTDGINFHTDCASTLRVGFLHRDGHRMSPSHVYLGYYSHHPRTIPFTVHRVHPRT